MQENSNVFVFMSLVYNHEKYVIEHLESIKYLVESYGHEYEVDLYINDDYSRDSSKKLIELWLNENSKLFRNVKVFYNECNIGTCSSLYNMLKGAPDDMYACKITAADDIYSFENLFEVCKLKGNYSFLSGIPLNFDDGDLYFDKRECYGIMASQVLYSTKPLLDRFRYLSVTNAPNVFYDPMFLKSEKSLRFLKSFDVVEDWPLQVAIAEQCGVLPFILNEKVYVYYRRTQGSSYIVANSRFLHDRKKMLNYLLSTSTTFYSKLCMSNRIWLFENKTSLFSRIFDLNFIFFIFSFLLNFGNFLKLRSSFNIDVNMHSCHMKLIKKRSSVFHKLNNIFFNV